MTTEPLTAATCACGSGYRIYPFKRDWSKCPSCAIKEEQDLICRKQREFAEELAALKRMFER